MHYILLRRKSFSSLRLKDLLLQHHLQANWTPEWWLLQLQIGFQIIAFLLTIIFYLTDDAEFPMSVADDEFDLSSLVVGDDLDAVLEEVEKELGK